MEILNSPKEVAELLLNLNDLEDIVISAHIGPDGDAIGSISALLLALLKQGKKARAFLERFPEKYLSIPGSYLISTDFDSGVTPDTFISLDCADKPRLGRFIKYHASARKTINIDHHISNNNYSDYNYVNDKASATAEILYEILSGGYGFEIDADIGSALYAGILSDTGGFRHPATTPFTYFAAGDLIKTGADYNGVYKSLFHTRKPEELKIMSVAFNKMKMCCNGKVIWTSINNDELKQTGATLGELDRIVDYLKSVENVLVAVFFYQKPDGGFKASFRSEPHIDVRVTAEKFGGGGHKNAAGCTLRVPLNEAEKIVLKEIEAAVERHN